MSLFYAIIRYVTNEIEVVFWKIVLKTTGALLKILKKEKMTYKINEEINKNLSAKSSNSIQTREFAKMNYQFFTNYTYLDSNRNVLVKGKDYRFTSIDHEIHLIINDEIVPCWHLILNDILSKKKELNHLDFII